GKVLIAGGFASFPLASAEVYQPATQTPAGLVSIFLAPVNSSISPSQAQQFIATGTFSNNDTQTLASVTWNSSSISTAAITNDSSNHGVAFGSASGSTTITASAGAISGSTTLTVTVPPVLVSIAVTPSTPSVAAGLIRQFVASGTYSDNTVRDLTGSVTWNSSVLSIATINNTGL